MQCGLLKHWLIAKMCFDKNFGDLKKSKENNPWNCWTRSHLKTLQNFVYQSQQTPFVFPSRLCSRFIRLLPAGLHMNGAKWKWQNAAPTAAVPSIRSLSRSPPTECLLFAKPSLYLASVTLTGCHGRGNDKCLSGSMPVCDSEVVFV